MTASVLSIAAVAQETYENAPLAQKDLNGTARYVGMGGAMEALGADLSTIATNPAGIGMFRRSVVNGSFGFNSQSDAKSFQDANKTNMSFDQAGFVYAMRSGRRSYVNFGFSYSKSRNFDQILTAAGKLNGASQNKLSALKNYNDVYRLTNKNGQLTSDWTNPDNSQQIRDYSYTLVDFLYSNALLNDKNSQLLPLSGETLANGGFLVRENGKDSDGNTIYGPAYYNASGYQFGRASSGYIGEYNFNISGNSNDRVYWGLTFGLYDVHYKSTTSYTENLLDGTKAIGSVTLGDERKITGTGFDIKAGVIFRPVEDLPFRIGVYVHTPTWYDLTTKSHTLLDNSQLSSGYGSNNYGEVSESYDFKFYTPWRFGFSLGHTVGNYLALGATYEYSDYSTCDVRVNDGYDVDMWGNAYEQSYSDNVMKQSIKNSLKGVHTLKLGVEFKPEKNFAVRLGYNYLSAMYNKDGYKDGTLNSYGSYYSSTTDYTNWKDTHRVTAGFGYNVKNWNFDLAYQYSQTNGDFYPFMSYVDSQNSAYDNVCDAVKVSNKRNQVIMTIGYKF